MAEWNKLELNIRNFESLTSFEGNILKFMCPSKNSTFLCNNQKEYDYYRLRLGLSHLREEKFKHNLQDILNPIYNCGEGIKNSCHYLLHCSLYANEILALLNVFHCIDNSILELSDSHIVEVLLHGRKFLDV